MTKCDWDELTFLYSLSRLTLDQEEREQELSRRAEAADKELEDTVWWSSSRLWRAS